MKKLLLFTAILTLSGCVIKTFSDATKDVNNKFAMGKQLRDRCNKTKNIDHCLAYHNFKKEAEKAPEGADLFGRIPVDFEKALARWEKHGPY